MPGEISAMKSFHNNRRHFLKRSLQGAAALAGAWAVPSLIPGSALGFDGAAAPSERIRLGLIGCGSHGVQWNLKHGLPLPRRASGGRVRRGRRTSGRAQKTVDENHRPIYGDAYKPCEGYSDFRKLILRKDIDAVGNATPDHWHAIPTIMAAAAART